MKSLQWLKDRIGKKRKPILIVRFPETYCRDIDSSKLIKNLFEDVSYDYHIVILFEDIEKAKFELLESSHCHQQNVTKNDSTKEN